MPGPECRSTLQTRNLKEEKPLSARSLEFIRQLRNMRKVASLECGHRILNKKCQGLFFSKAFPHEVERGPKPERPPARVVSVAGHDVNQSAGQPAQGILLRRRAKNSRQRTCRHLCKATQPHPFQKPLCLQTQNSVALRMGDHRPEPQKLNLMQRLVHGWRNGILVEFNEQVIALIYAESSCIFTQ